jgi:phospho-2-dehydro-3-deoxyheptonate aldolase
MRCKQFASGSTLLDGSPRKPADQCCIIDLGPLTGCGFLDMTTPKYIAELVTSDAIAARTTESELRRGLASGLRV